MTATTDASSSPASEPPPPSGGTVAETWDAILEGRSGARPMTFDWVAKYELPVTFAATIQTPPRRCWQGRDPAARPVRASTPSSPRARPGPMPARPRSTPERLGAADRHRHRRRVDAARPVGQPAGEGPATGAARSRSRCSCPTARPATSPSSWAPVPARTRTVSACASGAEAMGFALDMIRTGRADVVVAGGTEAAIHPLPIAGFAAHAGALEAQRRPRARLAALRHRPRRLRAGRGRGGHRARERGARQGPRRPIYAELAGVGMSADSHHIAAPEPRALAPSRAMRRGRRARRPEHVRHRAHQRPRHLHAGRRHRRVQCHPRAPSATPPTACRSAPPSR